MRGQQISTVIITLNEASTIARCLQSVSDISDEILILDSGSTDDTVLVCQSFEGVTVIQTEWLGYSQTKNKGASLAKHQFILSIDADECLDQEAVNAIKQLKISGLKGTYSLNRKNYFGKRWIKYAGWYPDVKMRLYDKHTAQWTGDFVHETLTLNEQVTIQHIAGNILHYTVRDQRHHEDTVRKYARLAAKRDLANGKSLHATKAVLSAITHFIKIFIVKLGFLHGRIGFWIAKNSAKSKWLRFVYAKELSA